MTYKQAFTILDLENLGAFISQSTTDTLILNPEVLNMPGFLNLEEIYKKNPADPTIFGHTFTWPWPFNKIAKVIGSVWGAIEKIYEKIKAFFNMFLMAWFKNVFIVVLNFFKDFKDKLAKFLKDPIGFLKGVAAYTVRGVRRWIDDLRDSVSNFITGIKTYVMDVIVPKIKAWFKDTIKSVTDLWGNIITALDNTVHKIIDPIGNVFRWLWDRMKSFFEGVKDWWRIKIWLPLQSFWLKLIRPFQIFGAGVAGFFASLKDIFTGKNIALMAVVKALEGIAKFFWEAGSGLISAIAGTLRRTLTTPWFARIIDDLKKVFAWLESWFESLIRSMLDIAKKVVPSAPERGDEIETRVIALAKHAVVGLGAMTGLSMVVSTLSKVGLGHLSAIFYDFAGYKYITAAIIGGLATAAFAQPLKYYYNALFRPYLPKWDIVLDLYNRGIITEKELRFFAKFYGFPDKYVWHFIRYVATPISLLRQADMVTWDTSNKGELVEEMRFAGLEEAGVVHYMPAAWLRGKTMWLTRMVTEMMYSIRRGFALVPEMVRDIGNLRRGRETVASSGHRFLPRVTWSFPKMPSTSEILNLISKWATLRLKADGLVAEIKSQFREDLIGESEARRRLARIIKIPELVEGELAPLRARKAKREEPEKGKDLRKELKTILTRCYKEGFITHKVFLSEVKDANKIVDTEILITSRAEWEKFYDDRWDLLKTYKYNLENGLITPEKFRADLIEKGFRPAKLDRYLEYADAKFLAALKAKREKLESKLDAAEYKLFDLEAELSEIEEKLSVEEDPKEQKRLATKITNLKTKIAKAERKVKDLSVELEYLPAIHL